MRRWLRRSESPLLRRNSPSAPASGLLLRLPQVRIETIDRRLLSPASRPLGDDCNKIGNEPIHVATLRAFTEQELIASPRSPLCCGGNFRGALRLAVTT